MCSYKASRMDTLLLQEKRCHVCLDCGRRYSYPSGLYQHRKHECGKLAQFQCSLCPYRCKLKGNLKIHYFNKHQQFWDQQTATSPAQTAVNE
ncbi:hypothetical protein J6590_014751 [Homalodisca vitripennis]|nr:hypothetical protein J6590_014751 [Homalodisca vitripennis]